MPLYADNSLSRRLAEHFGLRENPFGVTPDPRFLFHSRTHREALASLINGVECGLGFQVLVAQPGMGKTTLLFNLLERSRNTAHTAFLFQPQIEPRELMQSLLQELGFDGEETSVRRLSDQLNQALSRAALQRRRVIIVVDEAQNLDFAVLEALRQLSNFETAQQKLLQIVLAGQPQLAKRLALPEQEQLRQRISAIARLSPLALDEAREYISHRLRAAGHSGGHLFTSSATHAIWDHSRGVPRNINTLCFNAMLSALAGNFQLIDEHVVRDAVSALDLDCVLADMYEIKAADAVRGSAEKAQALKELRITAPGVPSSQLTAGPGVTPSGNGGRPNVPGSLAHTEMARAVTDVSSTPGRIVPPATAREEKQARLAAKATPPPRMTAPRLEAVTPATPSKSQALTRRAPDSKNWWPKALSLVVLIAIFGFVLLQQLPGHPDQVQAGESRGPQAVRNLVGATSNAFVQPTRASASAAPSDNSARLESILFDQDSDIVRLQYRDALQAVANALTSSPETIAILEGHTDSTGAEAYNLDLSTRRAMAVRNVLIDEFRVPAGRLTTTGEGSAVPVQPNSNAEGRSYNRRVEIRLQPQGN